ncbi:sigma-70 family RNA polymerase sigma factor, partial [Daejeonella sp.]|uniref:RNA polymerase sigma factor n=1 Tax=Daejeonella sp. TaxID=2805397 RepID=UPI0030C31D24
HLSRDYSKAALTETDLVTGLGTGDRKSLEALYSMYCSSLFGIIRRIVREEEVAEDVLQETFIRIWQSFHLYDPSKGRLFTWMSNLARNLALDKLKSKSYRNGNLNDKISDLQNTVDNQFNVRHNPETIGVREIVTRLKPEYKSIIDLVYYRGYTHVEAAEELNIPVGTLKTRMRMAVNDLRKYFK